MNYTTKNCSYETAATSILMLIYAYMCQLNEGLYKCSRSLVGLPRFKKYTLVYIKLKSIYRFLFREKCINNTKSNFKKYVKYQNVFNSDSTHAYGS